MIVQNNISRILVKVTESFAGTEEQLWLLLQISYNTDIFADKKEIGLVGCLVSSRIEGKCIASCICFWKIGLFKWHHTEWEVGVLNEGLTINKQVRGWSVISKVNIWLFKLEWNGLKVYHHRLSRIILINITAHLLHDHKSFEINYYLPNVFVAWNTEKREEHRRGICRYAYHNL